jgi:tetratricopeptide (TPR) repeat protein
LTAWGQAQPKHGPGYDEAVKLVKAGKFRDAVTALGKAIQAEPRDLAAYHLRAFAWTALGEHEQAMADYNAAVRLDPKNWGVYVSRAAAWQARGEYDKSILDYNEAIRLNPKLGRLYTNRASVWNEKGEYDKALADVAEAIRLDPKDVYALVNRATARHAKGDFASAIADLQAATQLDPTVVDAFNGLAWLQATCPDPRLRDGQKAFENAKRAFLGSDRMSARFMDTLAAAYAEFGDFENACKWQGKAVKWAKTEQEKAEGRSRLKLYEQHKPYREDPTAR